MAAKTGAGCYPCLQRSGCFVRCSWWVSGLILLTHAHADWADLARRLIGQLGLDSSRNEIGRLISGLAGLGPRQYSGTGRLPSGTERNAGGRGGLRLLRRRRWGEYLTVVATALLFIPEIQELIKHPTGLKVCALLVNVVIVIYLITRLARRHHRTTSWERK
jgi:hypothetical protein